MKLFLLFLLFLNTVFFTTDSYADREFAIQNQKQRLEWMIEEKGLDYFFGHLSKRKDLLRQYVYYLTLINDDKLEFIKSLKNAEQKVNLEEKKLKGSPSQELSVKQAERLLNLRFLPVNVYIAKIEEYGRDLAGDKIEGNCLNMIDHSILKLEKVFSDLLFSIQKKKTKKNALDFSEKLLKDEENRLDRLSAEFYYVESILLPLRGKLIECFENKGINLELKASGFFEIENIEEKISKEVFFDAKECYFQQVKQERK